FSSRRRHTRFSRDWSSDVCSSDLEAWDWARSLEVTAFITPVREGYCPLKIEVRVGLHVGIDHVLRKRTPAFAMASMLTVSAGGEIGRASCRERVAIAVVVVAWHMK